MLRQIARSPLHRIRSAISSFTAPVLFSVGLSIAIVLPASMAIAQSGAGDPTDSKATKSDNAAAGTKPTTVKDSFKGLADKVKPSLAWKASSLEEHQSWHNQLKPKIVELLGEMPAKVPLEVEWLEEKEFDTFIRHKVLVRTEETYWAPVYYFVPKNLTEKTPAVICLHGHSGIVPYIGEADDQAGLDRIRKSELDYAVHFAKHGYIAAAIVVRGWNETADRQDTSIKIPRSCYQVTMNSFLLGMSPQGLRCWDAMRVIDFLSTQELVDTERLAVAGLSGGGTLAMYLPILEDRIQLVMIGGAFSGYRESIFDIHHCICNCLPGVMPLADMADVVGLYAPKPVLLINGVRDPIFPIAQAEQGFEQLQRMYKLLNRSDFIEADFFDGEHAWSNRKTVPFLEKHFKKNEK